MPLIVKLYEANAGAITSTPGLSLVPKLKSVHIQLTNFSKMRVDLAAQVCNYTVICLLIVFPFHTCRYLVKLIQKLCFLHLVRKRMKRLISLEKWISFLIHSMYHLFRKENTRGRCFSYLSEVLMTLD